MSMNGRRLAVYDKYGEEYAEIISQIKNTSY